MASWTQEQAIAFECAREAITDLLAIRIEQLDAEEAKPHPNAARIAELQNDVTRLGQERQNLTVGDSEKIDQIRLQYGEMVRAERQRSYPAAA